MWAPLKSLTFSFGFYPKGCHVKDMISFSTRERATTSRTSNQRQAVKESGIQVKHTEVALVGMLSWAESTGENPLPNVLKSSEIHPGSLTFSPLKIDGWKTSLSFWVSAHFRLKLPGRNGFYWPALV